MTEQRRSPHHPATRPPAPPGTSRRVRLPASALRPLVLAMAGLTVSAHAQYGATSAIPNIDLVEPMVTQTPEAPPPPAEGGDLVPRLTEPATRTAPSGNTLNLSPSSTPSNPNAPAYVSGDRVTGYSEKGVEMEGTPNCAATVA
jgi:LPS-assembly protein